MNVVKTRFKQLSDSLFLILATFFGEDTRPFNFRGYTNLISGVLNQTAEIAKTKFFIVLD